MQRLILCVVVAAFSFDSLRAQQRDSKAELTGEDVEKAVAYLNAGVKQSKNGKLKKEFKDLLTLLESSDSKEKVDLRAFPPINPEEPAEGQIGFIQHQRWTVLQVVSESELLVAPVVTTTSISFSGVRARQSSGQELAKPLKFNVETKGLVDDKELKNGIPGVFLVVGTETYPTVVGGSKTVWVLKPFDIEKAAAALKEARERPKRRAEPKDAQKLPSPGAKKPLSPADQERLESLRKQKAELERQRLAKEAQKDEKKPAAKEPAKR